MYLERDRTSFFFSYSALNLRKASTSLGKSNKRQQLGQNFVVISAKWSKVLNPWTTGLFETSFQSLWVNVDELHAALSGFQQGGDSNKINGPAFCSATYRDLSTFRNDVELILRSAILSSFHQIHPFILPSVTSIRPSTQNNAVKVEVCLNLKAEEVLNINIFLWRRVRVRTWFI